MQPLLRHLIFGLQTVVGAVAVTHAEFVDPLVSQTSWTAKSVFVVGNQRVALHQSAPTFLLLLITNNLEMNNNKKLAPRTDELISHADERDVFAVIYCRRLEHGSGQSSPDQLHPDLFSTRTRNSVASAASAPVWVIKSAHCTEMGL